MKNMDKNITEIQVGKNPSNTDAYLKIREQINFLSRPEKRIDWRKVANLSYGIFNQNGMDLQTLCYYTVAKSYLDPTITQINQNLSIMATLMSNHWSTFWPDGIQARINILNWLNKHISPLILSINIDDKTSKELYRLKNHLTEILNQISLHTNTSCNLTNTLNLLQEKLKIERERDNNFHIEEKKNINVKKEIQKTPSRAQKIINYEHPNAPVIEATHSFSPPKNNRRYISLLSSFCIGVILSFLVSYFYLQQKSENFQPIPHSSPGILTIDSMNIELQYQLNQQENIVKYVEYIQKELAKNQLKQKITQLQKELITAEQEKKGITISQLKTALYDMERTININPPIEQQLYQYSLTPQDYMLQTSLEEKLIGLLVYYYRIRQDNQNIK
ncbi:type VI secretion system ImpA family N-terminal domain-containing protein [Avibacterium avium]|uniref:type VI secretion system ImpA family N-terminal domain-containing protein n=1 Tax=Avibacterium TaxID=292486 RepID=UPI0020260558|nr:MULTISPECIES: type VI secretion system ImpA family N-terminal domain-containing protein [unclassified Avibacterium]MCW9716816.1 type VI secretion system ImpA family N-terminal domain-containing protein [Avibacterium sp. 21-599]MCW9734016.1 type VI secretion system ImpA family N-terminal domain-containing protein [Avibacterium sp. 20-15]URL03663.1 type VI secretion system ImpA family N-terminal domain-containing protein [Avibacterium sp. 20-132]